MLPAYLCNGLSPYLLVGVQNYFLEVGLGAYVAAQPTMRLESAVLLGFQNVVSDLGRHVASR